MSQSTLTPVTQGDLTPILELFLSMATVLKEATFSDERDAKRAADLHVEVRRLCERHRTIPVSFLERNAAASIIKRADDRPWNTFIEGTPV